MEGGSQEHLLNYKIQKVLQFIPDTAALFLSYSCPPVRLLTSSTAVLFPHHSCSLSVPGLHKSKSGIKNRMQTKNMLQFYSSGLIHSPLLILPTQCSRHTLNYHTTVFIWTHCGCYLLRVCTVSFLVFFSISCFAAL